MDSDRFDGYVRIFGQTRSRRQTLRGLAGLAAVGALALGEREADAAERSGGSPCTKGKQCKTGKCVGTPGDKTCSCSKKYPKCTTSGTSCQDGACTSQITPCDAQSCAGCCNGTTCKGGGACVCPALKANCTGAGQCTPDCEGAVACGPIGNPGQDQCCRPPGGPCSTPGAFDECCAVVFEPGVSGSLVYCGPDKTCGGTGAQCSASSTCASGVCCVGIIGFGVCCAAGQQCQSGQCSS